MDLGLTGRCALITGGTHGIGLATAKALAAEGCGIAVCSRSADRLAAAERELSQFGVDVLACPADVLRAGDADAVMDLLEDRWGKLDILVNNVGGGGRWGSENVEETELTVWQEVHEKNAMAAVRFVRRAIPLMRHGKWGRVVTVTSIYGKEGGGRPWFNMTKAAQTGLSKTLALTPYLVRDGITFNCVAPGGIQIPGTRFDEEMARDPEGFRSAVERDYPLGRLGEPEEVAAAVVFLCSAAAVRDNNPVVCLEHRWLYWGEEDVPEEPYVLPVGEGRVMREGTDVTEQPLDS